MSFVEKCFGSTVREHYRQITDTKSYYDRLPQMPVSATDIVLRDSSFIQKYEHGHFILQASEEVNSSLELLESKLEIGSTKSCLSTTKLSETSSNLAEELLHKYTEISENILSSRHEKVREIIREVLEEILSSIEVSASEHDSVDSVLSPTTQSCHSFSQMTGAGDCSFVTVWSRGSMTPADDLITRDLLSAEKEIGENDGKARISDHSSISMEENVMQEIVQKPAGCENKVNVLGRTRQKREFDMTKLFTDYANNPWQDPFNWFIGNFKSELQDELLYVPRTSEQFLLESHVCGDSVMIVQNWIALKEDWVLSWELGHQVTALVMPDNSGPDILLGPETGVCIIMTEPQEGVAASLLALHAAARDSCLQVWIVCVGDLSLYMESLVIARHPTVKEKELQMTPLFVPDTETMISTIVELGQVQWRNKMDIREDLTDYETFIVASFKSINNFTARLLVTKMDFGEFMLADEEAFHQLAWMSRSRRKTILEERRGVMRLFEA